MSKHKTKGFGFKSSSYKFEYLIFICVDIGKHGITNIERKIQKKQKTKTNSNRVKFNILYLLTISNSFYLF